MARLRIIGPCTVLCPILFATPAIAQTSIMLGEARVTVPAELARRFLREPHAEIVRAVVSPNGMDAPLPWVTSIQLFEAPRPSAASDFCQTTTYVIDFAVSGGKRSMEPQPAAPQSTRIQSYRRWTRDSRASGACDLPFKTSFPVDAQHEADKIAMVRSLAAGWLRARNRKRPGFSLSFTDELADQLDRYERSRLVSGETKAVKLTQRFANALSAFREIPLDDIAYVDPVRWVVFVGGEWELRPTFSYGKITSLTFKRRIPPPF